MKVEVINSYSISIMPLIYLRILLISCSVLVFTYKNTGATRNEHCKVANSLRIANFMTGRDPICFEILNRTI